MNNSILYVVATPIGNLSDITLRALEVFKSVDIVIAEDTRVTKKLLDHFGISKKIISYHQHSALTKIDLIKSMLAEGQRCALVSDAGTPGINDPGNYLIKKLLEEIPDLKIEPVPGANAAATALSVSGFPCEEFVYLGFPPHKKGRQTFFKRISEISATIAFYESKHRIVKAMNELKTISELGERQIVVARELTKQFETIYRGTVDEIIPQLHDENVLGEFVIIIAPK